MGVGAPTEDEDDARVAAVVLEDGGPTRGPGTSAAEKQLGPAVALKDGCPTRVPGTSDVEEQPGRDGDRRLATAMTADTRPEEISASEGRERVSATTLSAPERCRRSVVNSEMKERCRVCLGERSAEDLMAPHNGLWSVKTGKCRPSR